MSGLAALLLGLGLADLVRAGGPPLRRVALPAAAGVLAVLAQVVLAGQRSGGALALLLLDGAVVVGWVVLADRALATGRGHLRALAVPATGVALAMALSGWAQPVTGPLARWVGWLEVPDLAGVSPDRALLVAGLLLIQLATGNLLVRLVLTSVGAMSAPGVSQPSDRLRGGRLLGPMERVFILGLGLAGELTAAGIVIAAKGLIRWPELRAERAEDLEVGIDEVTEYFLVGSFVSWLLALAALGTALLAGSG